MPLREQIEAIAARQDNEFTRDDRAVFDELKRALNRGEVRAAEKSSERQVARKLVGEAGFAARLSHGGNRRHVCRREFQVFR